MIRPALVALFAAALAGCGETPVDSTYGRSRGPSINGTSALAVLFRQKGHEVRSAVRLREKLGEWADVLVRFAPRPGPPDQRRHAGADRRPEQWPQRWPVRAVLDPHRSRRVRLGATRRIPRARSG